MVDNLQEEIFDELCRIPLIDPHSHIDPRCATSRSLDDILGYHYYTELAHSAGMDKGPLGSDVEPRERVRAILQYMARFDNTVQYSWFVEIARSFLDYQGDRVSADDCDRLFDTAAATFSRPDWEERVFAASNLEKIFLTNEFDDDLSGFDTNHYVPCLRTDTLVFGLHRKDVRERLARVTGIEVNDPSSIEHAIGALFTRFIKHGARACAISLPPSFTPRVRTIVSLDAIDPSKPDDLLQCAEAIFWMLAKMCHHFKLPFDLMIGVERGVYVHGVYQGQDLFDQRLSLIQYANLFNEFPAVTFPISVLSSGQNQELVSFSWIFPNIVPFGHWWYSNIPAYIESDLRARLQAVPRTKPIGYYSDAYKLEFVLPKYNMYRRILAAVLANDFVRAGRMSETQAVELGRCLLRDNVQRIFNISSPN